MLAIIDGMYRDTLARLGAGLDAALAPAVRAALASHSPRRAGRILELAMGYMAVEGRTALAVPDVDRAARMAEEGAPGVRRRIGFTP